jgi:hypothetical protein
MVKYKLYIIFFITGMTQMGLARLLGAHNGLDHMIFHHWWEYLLEGLFYSLFHAGVYQYLKNNERGIEYDNHILEIKNYKHIQENIMNVEEKDVRVKMSICPECKNAICIAIEHTMTEQTKKDFMKEVTEYNLDVKTISLAEYQQSAIEMFCNENCSKKKMRPKEIKGLQKFRAKTELSLRILEVIQNFKSVEEPGITLTNIDIVNVLFTMVVNKTDL